MQTVVNFNPSSDSRVRGGVANNRGDCRFSLLRRASRGYANAIAKRAFGIACGGSLRFQSVADSGSRRSVTSNRGDRRFNPSGDSARGRRQQLRRWNLGIAQRMTRNVVKLKRNGATPALVAAWNINTRTVQCPNNQAYTSCTTSRGFWERTWVFRPRRCIFNSSMVFSICHRWWYSLANNSAGNLSMSNKLVIKRYVSCSSGLSGCSIVYSMMRTSIGWLPFFRSFPDG